MTGALSAALSSARRIIGPDAAAIADAPTALMNVRRDDALPCACLMALAPEKSCVALARSRGRRTGAGILTGAGGKRQYPAIPVVGQLENNHGSRGDRRNCDTAARITTSSAM